MTRVNAVAHASRAGYVKHNNLRTGEWSWPACKPCQDANVLNERHKYTRLRELVFDHYGTACACCGATECLSIDHVESERGKHFRLTGSKLYRWLVKHGFPNDPPLQVLCVPCNTSKQGTAECRMHNGGVKVDGTKVTFRLDPGLYASLKAQAECEDRAVGSVISSLVAEYLAVHHSMENNNGKSFAGCSNG